jgi:hypothetical protein
MKLVNQPDLPLRKMASFSLLGHIHLARPNTPFHLSALHATDDVKQCGFAGAGGADDGSEFSMFDGQRNHGQAR